jgi:hypothetical protein
LRKALHAAEHASFCVSFSLSNWVLSSAVHHFVEFNVFTMLESDMAHAYYTESNRGMTATDTQKNAVYYVAKQVEGCLAALAGGSFSCRMVALAVHDASVCAVQYVCCNCWPLIPAHLAVRQALLARGVWGGAGAVLCAELPAGVEGQGAG